MLDQLNDYDWEEVFKYATPTAVLQETVSTAPFSRDDVRRIIGMADGTNDEADWVGAFELNDGRFVSISAGCDYTGWGCQESGGSQVASTEAALIRYGLTDEDRQRMGIVLPEAD